MLYDLLLALAAVALLLSPLVINAYPSRELRRRLRAQQNRRREEIPPSAKALGHSDALGRARIRPRNALKWLFLQQETVPPRSSGK
ncbi:MAG: hypothetical protein ACLGQX_10035 [Acidobacteriota bacterium]|jgi:hypothetical protein